MRDLQQLAKDVEERYPLASKIILTSMYVDDVLAGAPTEQEAVAMICELQKALSSAGFPLRKWTANKKDVLKHLPADHLLHADFLEIDEASSAKTLGVRWKATTDEFYFVSSPLNPMSTYTKRTVLSQIAKLFDPAGWLAPFVVQAKLFMQELWLRSLEWDDQLPDDLLSKWREFLLSYQDLNQVKIPRWIRFQPMAKIQFHGFCDASQRAYGAAIYIRVETEYEVTCSLLVAKSRVAPVKTISLPRLELCGAVLLSELFSATIPQLQVSQYDLYYWTDSTIVLAWLNKPPCTWTTFVANRVSKIVSSTVMSHWYHVRSEENPADLPSRGIQAQELSSNTLWWQGPTWLRTSPEKWADQNQAPPETILEQRAVKVHSALASSTTDVLARFSDLGRALRVLAYTQRFIKSCRKTLRQPSVIINI